MKKFLYSVAALALVFSAASCQQENLEPVAGSNTVTYTVQVAGAGATKALGDVISNVNELHYEVYRTDVKDDVTFTDADNLLYHKTADVDNGFANITLELVNNQNFTVLFWAQVANNGVYTVTDLTNVTVATSADCNLETTQAFSGVDFIEKGESLAGRTVTLTRPISQLNIATTKASLTAFDDDVLLNGSSVTVKGLSQSFNVAKQEAGDVTDVVYTYSETAVPAVELDADYQYVAMNYVGFAPVIGASTEVTYKINTSEGDIENTVSSVPMKPNYRTNIIGNLITSTSDYEVTLNAVWGGKHDYVVNEDGSSVIDGVPTVFVSNDAELEAAITAALTDAGETKSIMLASGTYGDLNLTEAEFGTGTKCDLVFKAAGGATPVIAGTVKLGYRNQGVACAMWNGNVTFEGVTFDHAASESHSLDVGDVKSLTLKNCKIISNGEYGIKAANGNATGPSKIIGCTFENAGIQGYGNYCTGLVIDDCDFNQSCVNIQGGNGVTVQNCRFDNKLTTAHDGQGFYCIRSNSTPITVKNCTIDIDSELTNVATSQAKWYLLANRGTTNWTVENVAVTMTDAALMQTELKVTACTSTGEINTTNLTVNGKGYASTAAQLTSAVATATDIYVQGEFKMPSSTIAKEITITGMGAAVIDNTLGSYWDNATLTFNNVNFKTSTGKANGNGSDDAALYSKNVTYNSCDFSGPMILGRDGAGFNYCTFNDLGNDYVWTMGNAASFIGCTFNSAGKALLVYSHGNGIGTSPAVSVTGCTFNATQAGYAGAITNQACAAIEIHNYGCGVTLTTSGNNIDSDFSGEWRIKQYDSANNKIYVNGTEYTTLALDGSTMTINNKEVTVQ